MNASMLLMDVGGTRTRAQLLRRGKPLSDWPATETVSVSAKEPFLAFIERLMAEKCQERPPDIAILAVAAVVQGRRRAVMTNWTEPRELDMTELEARGLPAGRTFFVNDMEAAGYRLAAAGQAETNAALDLTELYRPAARAVPENRHMILLAPGTGTGTVSVLPGATEAHGQTRVIPGEGQHAAIPALDEEHAEIIAAMSESLQRRPSWEDFISGRGMEAIYRLMHGTSAVHSQVRGRPALDADKIAARAVAGGDPLCHAVLQLYYRCLGALAQSLALTIQPFGGIYLAGASSRHNGEFIRRGMLLEALQRNGQQRALLERFPVYLVNEELNMAGAAHLAERCLDEDPDILALLQPALECPQ